MPVVDPVETIAKYGADALRWTLATGTAPGQDLNLSLDRVTAARNFTNKLWQARTHAGQGGTHAACHVSPSRHRPAMAWPPVVLMHP